MKAFTIKENEADQRLDKYLRKLLSEAPGSFIYKMLRKKNIVLNAEKATGAEHLKVGDTVTLFLSEKKKKKFASTAEETVEELSRVQAQPAFAVIYEDDDVLVINKPAGMLSQKARESDISANEHIIAYLLETKALTQEDLHTFRPSICNRLDRNTSGVLLAGKTLHGLQKLSR